MIGKSEKQNQIFNIIFATIFFIAVFTGCIVLGPRILNMDGDLGRHITVGEYIIDSGKIPVRDIFSNTMLGNPFTPHEWLAEVAFAFIYLWQGLTGVVLLTGFVIGLTWYWISYVVISNNRSFYLSILLILVGIAASSIHWLSRPHVFTFLFLIVWVLVYKSKLRLVLKSTLLGIIMVVWVNTHGAFVTGIVYLLIDLLGSSFDQLINKKYHVKSRQIFEKIIVLVSASVAIFINPVGYKILDTISGFLGSSYLTSHTIEYQPPNLLSAPFIPYLIFLFFVVALLIIVRKQISLVEVLQLIIWCIFGLISARNIPLAIIVSLPIISSLYTRIKQKKIEAFKLDESRVADEKRNAFVILPGLSIAISSLIIVLISINVQAIYNRNVFLSNVFPVQAVDYLEKNPPSGNMFNEFTWGGYLLYRMWPDQMVFIDGQTDFYGEDLTREYEIVYSGSKDYKRLLEKYKIDWVIVNRKSDLARILAEGDIEWQSIYKDGLTSVFARK